MADEVACDYVKASGNCCGARFRRKFEDNTRCFRHRGKRSHEVCTREGCNKFTRSKTGMCKLHARYEPSPAKKPRYQEEFFRTMWAAQHMPYEARKKLLLDMAFKQMGESCGLKDTPEARATLEEYLMRRDVSGFDPVRDAPPLVKNKMDAFDHNPPVDMRTLRGKVATPAETAEDEMYARVAAVKQAIAESLAREADDAGPAAPDAGGLGPAEAGVDEVVRGDALVDEVVRGDALVQAVEA
jgi:hypothetical protein